MSKCFLLFLTVLGSCCCPPVRAGDFGKWDFYSHKVDDILGRPVSLEMYRGKVSLVVNVASECGYTDEHYKQLVALQSELEGEGFTVLAFPCNQFGQQEPYDGVVIEEFATKRYKINFPLFGKMQVRGDDAHSIYKSIKAKTGQEPTWNFWKFLVDRQGHVITGWPPNRSVASVRNDVIRALRGHGEL